ncbi:MAG: PAS domain S-box protein [Candidatus Eremiobacterota bacterium]
MEYKLSDLIDLSKLKNLIELFNKISPVATAIIDENGNILIATGCQDICRKFHLANPISCKECRETHNNIKAYLQENKHMEYKCQNGLWNVALPVIITGKHLATISLGQFFYEGEELDIDFFSSRAKKFNFPHDEYMADLKKIPCFTKEKVKNIMEYHMALINFIIDRGLSYLRQIKAEKNLQESRDRFHYLVESTSDCIWEINEKNEYTYISPNITELLGYNEEEILGTTPLAHIPEEEAKRIQEIFTHIAEAKKSFKNLENITLHKNGHEVIIETSGVPMFDTEAHYSGYLGIARNITDRKKAEKALIESEQRYRELTDLLPQTVFELDLKGNFIFVNRYAYEATGYSPEDVKKGLNVLEIIVPEDREKAMNNIKEVLTAGRQGGCEYTVQRKDGTRFPVISYSSPIIIEGRPAGLRGIVVNITEQKKAEEERRKLEIQLLQSQKLESLGILAGGIAHDFNNILTGILGYADLALMETAKDSPIKEYIQQLVISARRASELTKQMLAYSGMGKFLIKPVNLSEVVKNMSKLLEISVSKKCLLTYNLSEDIPIIEGDIAQIQQIIMNLTINASEAIEDNGDITICTGIINYDRICISGIMGENLKEHDYVYLEIKDTGIGMTEEIQNKIFDPFFTTKFTGRGLGLAAVIGIVRGHNGTIKVSSTHGSGSVFTVFFPVSDKFESNNIRKNIINHIKDTVLVIDDEKTVLSVAEAMLKKLEFSVLTENDSRKTLDIFKNYKEKISLVLLDMTMPYMDGSEVFKQLKSIKPDVKVILTSGYNEQAAINHFTEKELAGFIQKPYTVEELKQVIEKVMIS